MGREAIREHYAQVARMVDEAERDEATGFYVVDEARSACSLEERSEALEIYEERLVEGIPERALIASRGCGDPVGKAKLQAGEVVLDLGCGGGVDAIIASRLVGPKGSVYGLDMTPDMLALASAGEHLRVLQKIVKSIQKPEFLETIRSASDPRVIADAASEAFGLDD